MSSSQLKDGILTKSRHCPDFSVATAAVEDNAPLPLAPGRLVGRRRRTIYSAVTLSSCGLRYPLATSLVAEDFLSQAANGDPEKVCRMCPISVVASQRLNDQLPFDTGERVPDQTADTHAIKGRQLDQFWRAETVRFFDGSEGRHSHLQEC